MFTLALILENNYNYRQNIILYTENKFNVNTRDLSQNCLDSEDINQTAPQGAN